MLFLWSLEIFISSREINLCRLDTFPTMVANRPVMYNRVPAFGILWTLLVCSCSYTQVSNRHELPLSIANKQTDAVRHCIFFNKACGVFFFRSVELTFFVNSFISCGMASPHITDASEFAIRKVSFNPNKGRLSVTNLKSPGSVADFCKSKMQDPLFRAYSKVSKR